MPGASELAVCFGKRVRFLRTERGLSRDKLALSIGLSTKALARLERGERFNAANLAPLAAALDCEVRDLFDFGDGTEGRIRSILLMLRRANPAQLDVAARILRELFKP